MLMKDEFVRRDLTVKNGMNVKAMRKMIKEDWAEHDANVPLDWLNRPSIATVLEPGVFKVLQDEMVAEPHKSAKQKQHKIHHGYAGWKHDDTCLQGDDCKNNQFEVEVPLYPCYFCFASECARCAGFSLRQKKLRHPLDFVCSLCLEHGKEEATPVRACL